jgi:hypothetical protein
MFFNVDPDICFPGEALLFIVVNGSIELGIYCTGHISHIILPKDRVKHEHVSLPYIYGLQSRLALDTERVIAAYIGHDVTNLTLVIHKVLSHVRLSCSHFLVYSFISIYRVFSFRFDLNVQPHNIIQCSPSSYVLGGKVILDSFQSSRPVLIINDWLLCCIFETDLMPLLVMIDANQNQVDCIDKGLSLDSLHVLQIIHTKCQSIQCPDGDMHPIVAQSNCCYYRTCHHHPSRIHDSFDGCIYIVNAIQVGNLIQKMNTTGARQIGRCG